MYNSGFTLLYKDEWQDWLLNDPKKFVWWLRLRSMATHEECVRRLIIGKSTVKVSISFGEIASDVPSFMGRCRKGAPPAFPLYQGSRAAAKGIFDY